MLLYPCHFHLSIRPCHYQRVDTISIAAHSQFQLIISSHQGLLALLQQASLHVIQPHHHLAA